MTSIINIIITITTLRGEVGADVVLVPGCAGEGIAPTTFVFESYGELRPDLLPPLVVLQFDMRLSTIFFTTCVSGYFRPRASEVNSLLLLP